MEFSQARYVSTWAHTWCWITTSAICCQLTLIQESYKLSGTWATQTVLVAWFEFESCCQIPQLDSSVTMASKQISAGPRVQSWWTLTLVYTKTKQNEDGSQQKSKPISILHTISPNRRRILCFFFSLRTLTEKKWKKETTLNELK